MVRATSTNTNSYQSLQVCRAIAGMLVVLYHLGGAFGADKYFAAKDLEAWTLIGHYSVVFFFVLSGFIMVRSHYDDFGRAGRLGAYLRKRAIRVYPAYLIILFGVYWLARVVPSLANSVPHDFWIMLKAALLLPQDRQVVGGTGAPVLIVVWSMQYEMVFYLLIACFIGRKWLGMTLLGLLLLNYGACKLSGDCSFPRSFLASNFILPFFFGAGAALLARSSYQLKEPLRVAVMVACIIGLLRGLDAVFHINLTLLEDGTVVYGLLSAVLIVALVHAEEAGHIRVHRFWGELASSSYALYLLHFPLISVLCKLAMPLNIRGTPWVYVAFVVIFVTCVVASQLFHFRIERPLVGWLLGVRKPQPGAVSGPLGTTSLS